MNDLVSIVVPAYNAGDFIAETIDSLLAQTYRPLEIIVINDGSKDKTADVARGYGARVQFFDQENQGQAKTLNRGWNLSRGRWIGYLSADDLLAPDAVAELVEALRKPGAAGIIYPDYDLIDARSKKIRTVESPDFDRRDLVLRSICQPGPGALFDRRVFEETGGWDSTLRQMPDFDFWLRGSLKFEIARLPKVLAAFRIHEESQTFMSPTAPKSEEPVLVMEKFFSLKPAAFSKFESRHARGYAHVLSARLHTRGSRRFEAASHLAKAFRLDPKLAFDARVWRLMAGGFLGQLRYRVQAKLKSGKYS